MAVNRSAPWGLFECYISDKYCFGHSRLFRNKDCASLTSKSFGFFRLFRTSISTHSVCMLFAEEVQNKNTEVMQID